METRFVESPSEVLGQFSDRVRALADEFASMGGTFVCAMSIKDDLTRDERMNAFAVPFDFSARGLADALANFVSLETDFDVGP